MRAFFQLPALWFGLGIVGGGFFGGGGTESKSKDYSGSQNQGYNDVEAGQIVNVGQAGGSNNRITVHTTDQGAVAKAFSFAQDALKRTTGATDAALDVVKGLKARELDSEQKKLGQVVLVGLLGLGAIQLIASRNKSK